MLTPDQQSVQTAKLRAKSPEYIKTAQTNSLHAQPEHEFVRPQTRILLSRLPQ